MQRHQIRHDKQKRWRVVDFWHEPCFSSMCAWKRLKFSIVEGGTRRSVLLKDSKIVAMA